MRNEISSCVFCREILLNTDICDNCGTNQKIARLICAEKISFKHNAFRPLLSMKPAKEQLYIEDTPVFQVNCNKRTFNNFTIIFLFSAIIIVGIYSHWFLLAPIVSYIMAYIFIAIYLISLFFLYHKFKNDWNITIDDLQESNNIVSISKKNKYDFLFAYYIVSNKSDIWVIKINKGRKSFTCYDKNKTKVCSISYEYDSNNVLSSLMMSLSKDLFGFFFSQLSNLLHESDTGEKAVIKNSNDDIVAVARFQKKCTLEIRKGYNEYPSMELLLGTFILIILTK